MTKESKMYTGVDRPTNIALARWLAAQAASRKDFEHDAGNYERHCMEKAVAALEADPPQVAKALEEAEDGVAHA